MEDLKISSIEDAIKDFRAGEFVIVVDDEDRENEGDLIIAAEKITPEKRKRLVVRAYNDGAVQRIRLAQTSRRQYFYAWNPIHCNSR